VRRTDVPATKSNLLRLREALDVITSGHELLDQKREILLEELVDVQRESGEVRREVEVALSAVYRALREALLAGGRPPLEAEALADAGSQRLRVRERSVMGVIVPLVEVETTERRPATAPGWGPASVARVRRGVRALLPALVRLAEIEVSCRRLAAELQKTQRRVNALEHLFIPEHRDTIRFIEGSLEEREREAFFHMKRAKARRETAGKGLA
jgi:V/A-type H+/Na+-transporting ATPase subunit D